MFFEILNIYYLQILFCLFLMLLCNLYLWWRIFMMYLVFYDIRMCLNLTVYRNFIL